jgi:uridine kinase
MVVDAESVAAKVRWRRALAPDPQSTFLVGIDGRGGAGKSTLARALGDRLGDATIVAFDDFYLPSTRRVEQREADDEPGSAFEWRRLCEQVIRPLASGASARYQRYDWDADAMGEWLQITAGGTLIIEGNYCTRPELAGFYDLTVWVEAPFEVRLRRGLERDGEQARSRWLGEWMPEEDRYVAATNPMARVDVVVDGSGEPSDHNP